MRDHAVLTVMSAAIVVVAGALSAVAREPAVTDPFIVVLGIAQDGGYPQAGCSKACCAAAWRDPQRRRHVVCLAVVDPATDQRWMFEATPDFREQLRLLDEVAPTERRAPGLDGILLTHGHIGHYTGLMHLGHEAIGARETPVHALPRMRRFLSSQGPWDQLVRYENIVLRPLELDAPFALSDRITVTAFRVPHREEYTEAVGFRIDGPNRSALFIPDIDKWERWDRRIETLLEEVDVAYLDGTFYAEGELPNRDMSAIPHPFIAESMARFEPLPAAERSKVRFIHLNHTNPALDPRSEACRAVKRAGMRVAVQGERVGL